MKKNKLCVLCLALSAVTAVSFTACNEGKISSNVNPRVDNDISYSTAQKLQDVFLDLGANDTKGEIWWENDSINLKKGSNDYGWIFTPKDENKYLKSNGKISVTALEPQEDLEVNLSSWNYGEEGNEPQLINNNSDGDVEYEYSSIDRNVFTKVKPTQAGNYIIKAKVSSSKDYVRKEVLNMFSIMKKELNSDMLDNISDVNYNGESQKPEIKLDNMEENKDYEIKYEYRKDENSEYGELVDDFVSAGEYRITICGKGNYFGCIEKEFKIINNQNITENNKVAENTANSKIDEEENKQEENKQEEIKQDETTKKDGSEPEIDKEQGVVEKDNEENVENDNEENVENDNETDPKGEQVEEKVKSDDEQTSSNLSETQSNKNDETENVANSTEKEIKDENNNTTEKEESENLDSNKISNAVQEENKDELNNTVAEQNNNNDSNKLANSKTNKRSQENNKVSRKTVKEKVAKSAKNSNKK